MSVTPVAKPNVPRPRWRRGYTVALITLLGLLLRVWAAWQLPRDADEPVYQRAGFEYAQLIKAGNLQGVIDYPGVREHPALVKLLYSLPFLISAEKQGSLAAGYVDRAISVAFGALTVLLLAWVDPLAGLLLAAHSMALKYSSEVYLEAAPMTLALLAVLAFERAQIQKPDFRPGRFAPGLEKSGFLMLSAVALGAAGAGKYTYLVVAPVIAFIALYRRAPSWKRMLAYASVALLSFWLLNPSLWNDPFNRLLNSLLFHPAYSQSRDVLIAGYPWYQPLVWISNQVPWHAQVFFFPVSDELVFWLALPGLYFAWRKRPWVAVWIVIAIVVLLLWPTKWPQYTLIMTAPLCLAAGATARWLCAAVTAGNPYWETIRMLVPRPSRGVWALLIAFLLVLVGGRVIYEAQMTRARAGWSQLTVGTAPAGMEPLPSNAINAIAPGQTGEMALATDGGVTFWRPVPNAAAPWGNSVSAPVYTPENSGLPSARVTSALQTTDGAWWFGTEQGVARYDSTSDTWAAYHAADLKLPGAAVRALHQDGQDHVWVGTLSGVARWDGAQRAWTSFTAQPVGLLDNSVFAIASQGDVIWFGTLDGISRFDARANEWEIFSFRASTLGWRGVTDLLVAADGQLWAATQGGGLAYWDGAAWQFYRANNSDIPYNIVNRLVETAPGILWVSFGFPTEPGGIVARFDSASRAWQTFTPHNSGYIGYEAIALARDATSRLWIGTATGGLQVFEYP